MDIVLKVIYAILMISVVMSFAGYAVLAERKVASWMQSRIGPNRTALPIVSLIPVVGRLLTRLGIWQPLADGLKFLFKEDPLPGHVKKFYYCLAPVLALIPAFLTMIVVPFGVYWVDGQEQPLVLANLDIGILFILAISSLGVYSTVLAGWSANSKYPFFGGIRSSAQMISYELALSLSILPVLIWVNGPESNVGGLTLFSIVQSQEHLWLVLWQPLSALLFLVALFAETNRLPFDMPESETELVGGFHTEYGSFKFGLFFVAEYIHIIVGSAVFVILFLGGWHFLPGILDRWPQTIVGSVMSVLWFLFKIFLLVFFFIWVRWTLPRFRYDQVMRLGWRILIPLGIANLIFYIFFIALIDRL